MLGHEEKHDFYVFLRLWKGKHYSYIKQADLVGHFIIKECLVTVVIIDVTILNFRKMSGLKNIRLGIYHGL